MKSGETLDGYGGLYQVSNYGRIKSISYLFCNKKSRILKANKNKENGYLKVTLCRDGKTLTKYIHRIVGENFIPNLNNYPTINHKDENKINNKVNNLEWCTVKYNINYGTGKCRHSEKAKRKVIQYDLNMNFIKQWNSITEAWKMLKIHKNNIMKCCQNKQKTAGGFIWKYTNE